MLPGLPIHRADAALAAGRTLAWALLIGGWLVLAALGRQGRPLATGGLWLPAVWLMGTALALAWAGRKPVAPAAQALWALALAALAAGLAWADTGRPAATAGLALAWGALLAVAATVVRGLRLARLDSAASRPGLPTVPAAAGALLAWVLFGGAAGADAASLRHDIARALPLAALALAALALVQGRAASACRSGLFDCAWPPLSRGALGQVAQWPQLAAALAMLPMMAALPWMAAWCGRPGASSAELAGQHLAAMLLPAVLASALPAWRGAPAWLTALPRHGVAALLALGGLALAAWPGRDGLSAAAIAQGLAWGLAWRLRLAGEPNVAPISAPRPSAARGLGASALALLLFGLALEAFGPQALAALHGALALAGVAGLASGVAAIGRRLHLPARRSQHEKGGPQAASHAMRAPSAGAR